MSAPLPAGAVLAAYVKNASLVDGTIRVVLDVEPQDRMVLYAMCDKPGAAIVLCRVTDQAAQAASETVEAPSVAAQDGEARLCDSEASRPADSPSATKRPLALASRIALTCGSPTFQRFLSLDQGPLGETYTAIVAGGSATGQGRAALAEETVKAYCGVLRKREVEQHATATARWGEIEESFRLWQREAA